jgi:hypothetical protein
MIFCRCQFENPYASPASSVNTAASGGLNRLAGVRDDVVRCVIPAFYRSKSTALAMGEVRRIFLN